MSSTRGDIAYDFCMRYALGFDGGGTKTECVLMDEAGNVLAMSRSGPSNPVRVGFEQSMAAIKEAAGMALSQADMERGAIAAVCAGLAGTRDRDAAEQMRGGLAAAFPEVLVKVCTDLEIALAATGDGPVILLIAGTGSAAVGRGAAGQVQRAGGLGPQVGDEGSANDIGKQAVIAAKEHREREGVESSLGKQLLRQIGAANWSELQGGRWESREEFYPRLFPVVANAADAGDEMARDLLRSAAGHLAALVKELIDRLGLGNKTFRLVKTGGMIGRSAFFDAELEQRLQGVAPSVEIGVLGITPANAAARIALGLIASASPGALHA